MITRKKNPLAVIAKRWDVNKMVKYSWKWTTRHKDPRCEKIYDKRKEMQWYESTVGRGEGDMAETELVHGGKMYSFRRWVLSEKWRHYDNFIV